MSSSIKNYIKQLRETIQELEFKNMELMKKLGNNDSMKNSAENIQNIYIYADSHHSQPIALVVPSDEIVKEWELQGITDVPNSPVTKTLMMKSLKDKADERKLSICERIAAIDIEMDVPTPADKNPKDKRERIINENSPEWLYIQNPNKENYKFEDGKLIMTASKSSLTDNNVPSFLGRRQESPSFYSETEIILEKLDKGVKAGLTLYQINDGHFDFSIRKNDDETVEVVFGHTIKSLVGEKKC